MRTERALAVALCLLGASPAGAKAGQPLAVGDTAPETLAKLRRASR